MIAEVEARAAAKGQNFSEYVSNLIEQDLAEPLKESGVEPSHVAATAEEISLLKIFRQALRSKIARPLGSYAVTDEAKFAGVNEDALIDAEAARRAEKAKGSSRSAKPSKA